MSRQLKFAESLKFIDRPNNSNNQTKHFGEYSIAYLSDRALICQNNGVKISLNLADAVGVSVAQTSPNSDESYFTIHAYPLVTKSGWLGLGKKRQRILQNYHFSCPNADVRSRWIRAIQNILRGCAIDSQSPTIPRRIKIILNPISGKKQGRQIFQQIRPLLDNSYLEYTLTETNHAGEIQKILSKIDLSEVDGIVLVGGDGSIHEAINGLIGRSDWQTAILKPIGVIPAGTGNGLVKTLLEIAGEPYDPVSAAFLIAKGKQRPIDIAITQQNGQSYYSFLSMSWAIISDVDIESERLRFLGSLRTDIYALIRIWNMRHYSGKFSYLPATDNWQSSVRECQTLENCFPCLCEPAKNISNQSNPIKFSENALDGWQAIADDFVLFWAMNINYATHDIKAAPQAHLSDGNMDVILARRGISKFNLLLAFLKSAQGEHISIPEIEYYKVRRFRLEPKTSQGIFAVDGEKVEYLPIQMEVKRGLARVMCG